ncbi:MAG TPA: hypothetical protein VH914_11960 [Acidimicrobiia bacterium]|nr:hypothetical protein [Acidimicrobiia bacterium]
MNRPPEERAPVAVLGCLGALAVVAALLALHATRHGVSYFGDSGAYLGMAENLRHGHGLTLPFDLPFDRFTPLQAFEFHGAVPSTHFPPGYPLALTLFSPPGVAVTTGARVLGCVLVAANVVLSARLTARLLPRSQQWFQLATPVLLIGVSGQPVGFLLLHAELGSEALFITALLSTLLLACRYFDEPSARRLAALTTAAAVAVLTRNVGLFLLVLLVPAIALVGARPNRARIGGAVAFAGGAVAPWVAFLVYGRILGGGSEGSGLDQVVYHPLTGTFADLMNVAGSWIVSPDAASAVHGVALLAVGGFVAIGLWIGFRPPSSTTARSTALALAAVFVYAAFVLWSQTFIDAGIPTNDRLFAPIRPVVTALFVAAFAAVTARIPTAMSRALLVVVVAAAVVPGWRDQRDLVRIYAAPAHGYPELASIRNAPRSTLIESPNADVVMLAIHRNAISTARPVVPVTNRRNPCFERDLAENAALLDYYGGYAYFSAGRYQITDATTPAELGRLVHLVPVSTQPTGMVFRVARVPGAAAPRPLAC